MNQDLKNIKEKYGEKMMHLCRKLFPTILEKEGTLYKLLEDNFDYSKSLYEDIVNNSLEYKFKDFIYSMVDVEEKHEKVIKTPNVLLEEVGYDFYECKTESDIQNFRKYYALGEELCTFRVNRLEYCHVFFAVKKDVDEIKRENFKIPRRQDEYGTSVISIQFSKGRNNTLSIKNRYNHKVNNPDATFSNNLDNIIPGLTDSFEKYYNLNITQNKGNNFEIPGYVRADDGKFYKYNYEINNKYYCTNNIIIDNFRVIDKYQEKEKYIVMDYFIIDLVNKKVYLYDENYIVDNGFLNALNGFKNVEIKCIREDKVKEVKFIFDNHDILIKLDKNNRMFFYKNDYITKIDHHFLDRNKYLEHIELNNVLEIGDCFLESNKKLNSVSLNKIIKIGNCFLEQNLNLEKFYAPNLNVVGYSFLPKNEILNVLNVPNLNIIGNGFLFRNNSLLSVKLPNLIIIGDSFLFSNKYLEEIFIPRLEKIGNNFLKNNNSLKIFNASKLKEVGDYFLYLNNSIVEMNTVKLKKIGDFCLFSNSTIEKISLPNIEKKCKYFGLNNNNFKKILNLRK